MTFLNTWEDFEKAAERLYLQDPMKVRIFKKPHNFKRHNEKFNKTSLYFFPGAICYAIRS